MRAPRWAAVAAKAAPTMCLLLMVAVTGCSTTRSWLDNVTSGSSPRSEESVILGAPSADDYLRDLHVLATGDPATQVEIFADAESKATLTPDPSTTLKFALVLATPGHSGTDPTRAQSLFRELLTQPELMTQAEISLAEIHLRAVEERIVLSSEARRLRESSSRAARTEEQRSISGWRPSRRKIAACGASSRTPNKNSTRSRRSSARSGNRTSKKDLGSQPRERQSVSL